MIGFFGELIKRDSAENRHAAQTHTSAYTILMTAFVMLRLLSIPIWRPLVRDAMVVSNAAIVLMLRLVSLAFYVTFAFNNIADSVFCGSRRTDLMLYQSLIVNTIFYGVLFVLYQLEFYRPTSTGIAVLFGIGIAINSAIPFLMYIEFRRSVLEAAT